MRPSIAVAVIFTAFLLACAGGDADLDTPGLPALLGAGTADDPHIADCWTTGAHLARAAGETAFVTCPSACTSGAIWGTMRYTPDSKVCVAAVHAGVVNVGAGGTVLVTVQGGFADFKATTQNGVTSLSWSSPAEATFSVGAASSPPDAADRAKNGKGGRGAKGGKNR